MEQEGKERSVANMEEPAAASVDFLDKSKFVRYLHRFALRIPKNLSYVVAKILSGYYSFCFPLTPLNSSHCDHCDRSSLCPVVAF